MCEAVMVDLLTQHAHLSATLCSSYFPNQRGGQPMHGRVWLDGSVRAAAVDSPVAVIVVA